MLPYLVDNDRVVDLPSYNDMEERISQKFPGKSYFFHIL